MNERWFDGDGLALAQAIVAGRFSAVQALEHTLADVRRENARLNAVASLRPEVGMRVAQALDAELAACATDAARQSLLQRRPFFGVPLLLKDIGAATAHVDLPSRMGSRLYDREAPDARGQGLLWAGNGALTERYLAAGFVPFGRSTTPEMGISASTEALAYGGPTRSPFNTEYSSGGSSGGAAALVASGALTLAHANDGAGSIRIPASCCGLVGLKPTRGLMPMGPFAGESWGGMAIDHVLTRTLRDCAAVLDATAGADLGAPYAAPPKLASYLSVLDTPPPTLRVAVCATFFEGDAVHTEVAAAVENIAGRLARWGHAVERAAPPLATMDVVQPLMQVVGSGVAQAVLAAGRLRGRAVTADDVEPVIWGATQTASHFTAPQYLEALASLHALGRRMAAFHERCDVLLTPVLAEPPARIGRFAMKNPDFVDYRLGPNGLWRYSPFTPLANATGVPSLAIPAARSELGLPIGVMLSGRFGDDALLLQVAAQLQRFR